MDKGNPEEEIGPNLAERERERERERDGCLRPVTLRAILKELRSELERDVRAQSTPH